MPELPDLQVFAKNLHKKLAGKKVEKISVANPSKLNVSLSVFKNGIEGQVLDKVHRVGKRIFFDFNNGNVMAWHLLINGELFLYEEEHDQKHALADISFTDKTGLLLVDLRHMAKIEFNPEASEAPDALSKKVNFDFLKKNLKATKTNLKKFLLDQDKITGIGNAYSDEILWHARISPFSICEKIPDAQIRALDKAIKSVLEDAEKKIHAHNPDLISGEVRDFLDIHNDQKTHSPGGAAIEFIVTGGRKTFFTKEQLDFR